MILRRDLNSLTEDELDILLYIVNSCPKTSAKEFDFGDLTSYRKEVLKAKFDFALNSIKEENKEKINEIRRKLL